MTSESMRSLRALPTPALDSPRGRGRRPSGSPSLRRQRQRNADERYAFCSVDVPGVINRGAGNGIEWEGDMIRYGFTIRTRTGQRIENVSIIAGSQLDAERRLRQMYIQCEIMECRERSIPRRFEAANAHMIDLMAISPPTIQHHG